MPNSHTHSLMSPLPPSPLSFPFPSAGADSLPAGVLGRQLKERDGGVDLSLQVGSCQVQAFGKSYVARCLESKSSGQVCYVYVYVFEYKLC